MHSANSPGLSESRWDITGWAVIVTTLGYGDQGKHGRAHPVGDRLGRRGIELAVEVQEGQAVDHRPEGCRQGVGVELGEGAPDERSDAIGDGSGRGDPFAAATVTRIAEHRAEKGPAFKRELDVTTPTAAISSGVDGDGCAALR
jgi:hypothetical protein